ncbi:AGAP013469-PA, partial [Anopheles gambiae str. PEST]
RSQRRPHLPHALRAKLLVMLLPRKYHQPPLAFRSETGVKKYLLSSKYANVDVIFTQERQ